MPRTGVRVRYEIITPDGPLSVAEGGLVTISFLTTIGVACMDFEWVPREPPFPDGPYRLAVFMDEVAVLSWSVGAS